MDFALQAARRSIQDDPIGDDWLLVRQ